MRVVLEPSTYNINANRPNYGLIDGPDLTPTQLLSNALSCADLLEPATMSFANVVCDVGIFFPLHHVLY
jgi:hypothetical protein